MGGRKKKSSSSSSAPKASAPIVKAGEVTGGQSYEGSLSGADKKAEKKKGTLADSQNVGVLAQALVDKLGQ